MLTSTLTPKKINIELLLKRLNNDDGFLREILRDFIKDVQSKMLQIKIYLLEENFEGIQLIAHALKGTALYLTAHYMQEAAYKLENAAKKKDTKFVFAQFRIFENEFAKLIEFLNADLNHYFH